LFSESPRRPIAGGLLSIAPTENVDALLAEIFASTPLLFIKEFLRDHRKTAKQIRIGGTREEVRSNFRDAILSKRIGYADARRWLREVEGWGKQHLYLARLPKRSLTHAHLLSNAALTAFLKRKRLWAEPVPNEEPAAHSLSEISVDDEAARITWRSHAIEAERHEEMDYTESRDDGEYEFRAFRRIPRRAASRIIVRKTDGVVAELVDLPLGDEHQRIRTQMSEAARAILAPLTLQTIHLSAIVSALDEGAVKGSGPRPKRSLNLGVSPTQARYRTDGAKVEFKSTRESAGYTDSDAVRHVRRAMHVASFLGEAGKFRLTFESHDRQPHDMIVSLNASDNRIYLYSRMSEEEVLSLVDQLISLE
jgi:hypothetical protein